MLYTVRIETNRDFAPLVEAGLQLQGQAMACWQHAETGATSFEEYLPSRAEADVRALELRGALAAWADGDPWTVEVRDLPEAEWRDAWKAFFHTERVSPNVIIRPPWEPVVDTARCVVEINPGLSFGTGRHFTTRSCLQVLDARSVVLPGATLLDVGCGSGILSIAAVKLGYRHVLGFDNDPQAVQVARENAAVNGVADAATFLEARVGQFHPRAPYALVVANLQEDVLCRYAQDLAGYLGQGPEDRLVLSGLLNHQFAGVEAAFRAVGLVPDAVMRDAEWTTFTVRRETGSE